MTLKDDKGAPWTGEERVLVVGDKGEAVEWVPELSLTTLKTVASPGETVQVIALLPEEWGQNGKEQGPVWVTLSGTTIFSTKLQQVSGRTVVLPVVVEKRFGSAVYVSVGYPTRSGRWSERTLPLRIVPKERVLTVQTTAANSEAAPLGQQTVSIKVTDHRGKGVVSSVSLSVVDKAVYAVQPEFRPKVLEFFYPLVRNNVADFFSAEFQGYGYGHELARRLGAVSGVQFAMVKPPKKKNDERDTAYWSGNIVTDKTGAATVTFQLPSNQTLWTMTAVAADAAGRVGEGTGQFASRGKVIVHAAAPEFLRKGDEAQASVRVSRGAASNDGDWKKPVSVNVDGVGITAQAAATPFELKSKTSESVIPVTLRATAPGAVLLKVNVEGAPQQVSLQRHIDVDDATLSDIIAVSSAGGGQLTLKPDSGAQVDNVELIIQSGIADAIMADVRELLIYPHGCLEQLVATTAPPVSLLLVLEAQQRFSGLDADSQLLLSEARSRAQLGTSRIVAYANGGGFAWFPSAPASVEMTITALGGLAASHKAGLLAGQQAVVDKAVQWLDSQGNLSPYQEAWRAYVIALHAPQRAQARARAAVQSALANPSPLVGALAVLAAAEAGIANEAGTKDDVAKLAAEARAAFLSKTRVAAIDAWDFPLIDTGTAALLGHAAQRAPGDTAPIKQRFLELFADETLSTLDRATLIQHSLWLVAEDAARAGAMTPPKVTGAEVMFTPRGFGLASTLRDGTTSVSVERFDGVATLRATQRVPLSSATTPISDGFTISRSYWSVGSGAKTPITEGAAVAQGDLVWVQLKVDLRDEGYAGGAGRSAYSVIEDHLPAGFSPLQEDQLYRAAPLELPLVPEQMRQRVFSPRDVTFFLEESAWWMGSPREVGYVMRADFPGTFIAPPASVNDMYQSKAKARTAVATLRIQPSTNAK